MTAQSPDTPRGLEELDQYRFVGPCAFVMSTFPEMAELVRQRETGEPVQPEEVWIDIHNAWVRLDGTWISGWLGDRHFAFRPHWLNRWKIRMAARRWRRSALRSHIQGNDNG